MAESFLDLGLISPDQHMVVVAEQRRFPRLISQILVDLNFLPSKIVLETAASILGIEYVDLSAIPNSRFDSSSLEIDFCLENKVAVFEETDHGRRISLAMADPEDVIVFDAVRRMFREQLGFEPKIIRFLADSSQIEKFIHDSLDPEKPHMPQATDSIVGLVEQILRDAVVQNASDIHIIPQAQSLVIKLRLDGELQLHRVLHNMHQGKITTRVKIMAGLDIAESRRPQSGRFEQKISGFDVDFRVSTHATIHGEQVVIRLLNKSRKLLQLSELGFSVEHENTLKQEIEKPYGLILVSGPTGSGKTTSLYGLLQELNCEKRNVVSLEEPVEYRIHGVRQTEIINNGPINFASGVRSLLRQDPDVIMIGEIRDEETAQMALRASMTGHLVLSTVHSQDAFGIPMRLIDLGLTPAQLSGQILALVGQRLIKTICARCHGDGCIECHNQGYKGRTVIAEVMECTQELDEVIREDYSRGNLVSFAKKNHIKTMWDHAYEKVSAGITTIDEVKKVLGTQI